MTTLIQANSNRNQNYLDISQVIYHTSFMTAEKLRALLTAISTEIDCAMNDLVWREHPLVIESLTNAKELASMVIEDCHDELEELNFD